MISGTEIANSIYNNINNTITKLNIKPGLAIVLVGDKKESKTYIRIKKNRCKKYGLKSVIIELDKNINESSLITEINKLNNDKTIHGIIVQLPLPNHLNERTILDSIIHEKDVDGLGTLNAGKLLLNAKCSALPCTPEGCIKILDYHNIKIEGKHAVVIGRSNIVGKPMALMLLQRNATVTICHSKTKNIKDLVKLGDIVISACGKPEIIKGNWIKDNAFVIDVGINFVKDETTKKGYKLVGDVCFDQVVKKAFVTPVPGGVGPMTVAMLLNHATNNCLSN